MTSPLLRETFLQEPDSSALAQSLQQVAVFIMAAVGAVAFFAFLAVAEVARERRKEREAAYRHETARKLIEAGRMDAAELQRFLDDERQRPQRRRAEGLVFGGAILAAAGAGWIVATRAAELADEYSPFGLLPLMIGAVTLGYGLYRRKAA